jgi:2-desacetyl-2-hydroxyethyl bacteriochlorophyllide A dehydrogenase
MYAIEISEPRKMKVKDIIRPSSSEDLHVKVLASTICGSDLKILAGEMEGIKYPLIPGHEWVGIVTDTPKGYEHFMGKRIVPDILYCCNHCSYCKEELPNLCNTLNEPGLTLPGGFAEYTTIRPQNAHLVPENISDIEASLLEPLAVALYALKRVEVNENDIVLIIGGGGIGQLIGQCAKLKNPKSITLVDNHEFRLNLGKSLFADRVENPKKKDLNKFFQNNSELKPTKIFEVTGSANGIKLSFNSAQKNAEIAIVGYSGDKKVDIKTSDFMVKHLTVKGVLSPTNTLPEAINLVQRNEINLTPLVTHKFKLQDAEQAFKTAEFQKHEALRVAFVS